MFAILPVLGIFTRSHLYLYLFFCSYFFFFSFLWPIQQLFNSWHQVKNWSTEVKNDSKTLLLHRIGEIHWSMWSFWREKLKQSKTRPKQLCNLFFFSNLKSNPKFWTTVNFITFYSWCRTAFIEMEQHNRRFSSGISSWLEGGWSRNWRQLVVSETNCKNPPCYTLWAPLKHLSFRELTRARITFWTSGEPSEIQLLLIISLCTIWFFFLFCTCEWIRSQFVSSKPLYCCKL